jgi:hypothetical protein
MAERTVAAYADVLERDRSSTDPGGLQVID